MTVDVDITVVEDNLAKVRQRLAQAVARSGRPASSVRLVAVSKTFGPEHVRAAAAAGQVAFGENKLQEAREKIEQLSDLTVEWHLIGHLQSNKIRKAATLFHCIHSVDRLDKLQALDAAAAELGTAPRALIQVDLAGEATKHGAPPEAVPALVAAAGQCRSVQLVGLMVLPPYTEDPEGARPYFQRLRKFRDELVRAGAEPFRLDELSMGMSHDFHVAVEEGATIVRVGSAIFGARDV